MATSRKKALAYAYDLISNPRSHLRVELRQTETGVSLLHKRRVLTKVYLNRNGMVAANAMAKALDVKPPALGFGVEALVSTGLLFRVLALSDLDYRNPYSHELAGRLIKEATAMQRKPNKI